MMRSSGANGAPTRRSTSTASPSTRGYRGHGCVPRIVAWAREYCRARGKRFIRMDTGSGNDRLNAYYVSCGFDYLGVVTYAGAPGMPAHYQAGSSSLFEMEVD